MKNNKGITLIALVITIIVLLILAGITIAMLTGENGLLTNANKAKSQDIEASVDENVRMAIAAIRLEIATKAAATPSYDARKNMETLQTALLKDLKETSGKTEGWTVTAEPSENSSSAVTNAYFKITYNGADYTNSKNDTDAKIKYSVRVNQQTLTVSTQKLNDKNDKTTDAPVPDPAS